MLPVKHMSRADSPLSLAAAFSLLAACAPPVTERAPADQLGSAEGAARTEEGGRAAPPPASSPAQDGAEFTAGIVEHEASPQGIALLTDLRAARHEGFDRVVFDFTGDALPGYHVEYIDKPVRQCGSGAATPIAGDAWLEVRFSPANAHTSSGAPTIPFREKKVELAVVKELESVCDFEAHVTWVLGVARPNTYRVLALSNPLRLAVDVKH